MEVVIHWVLISTSMSLSHFIVSSNGLVVKCVAFCAKGHIFNVIKWSIHFQGLFSQITTSWVDDHVKWQLINRPPKDIIHSGSDHPQGILAPSFRTAPLWVVGEEIWTSTQWTWNPLYVKPIFKKNNIVIIKIFVKYKFILSVGNYQNICVMISSWENHSHFLDYMVRYCYKHQLIYMVIVHLV